MNPSLFPFVINDIVRAKMSEHIIDPRTNLNSTTRKYRPILPRPKSKIAAPNSAIKRKRSSKSKSCIPTINSPTTKKQVKVYRRPPLDKDARDADTSSVVKTTDLVEGRPVQINGKFIFTKVQRSVALSLNESKQPKTVMDFILTDPKTGRCIKVPAEIAAHMVFHPSESTPETPSSPSENNSTSTS